MECLSVERRTRGDTSFKGQETAACQARAVHATDGCIFWGMSLLRPLIFFPPRPAFSIYAQAVKVRTASFMVSHPAEEEPDSVGASGSHSPAILPDGNMPTCQQQIN